MTITSVGNERLEEVFKRFVTLVIHSIQDLDLLTFQLSNGEKSFICLKLAFDVILFISSGIQMTETAEPKEVQCLPSPNAIYRTMMNN